MRYNGSELKHSKHRVVFIKRFFRKKWVVAGDYYLKYISIHRISSIFSGTTKIFIIKCVMHGVILMGAISYN